MVPAAVRRGHQLATQALACRAAVNPARATSRREASHRLLRQDIRVLTSKQIHARRAELGIDLGGIWKRTRGVLTFQMGAPEMQELDVGGPLLFSAILGLSHLLVRAL